MMVRYRDNYGMDLSVGRGKDTGCSPYLEVQQAIGVADDVQVAVTKDVPLAPCTCKLFLLSNVIDRVCEKAFENRHVIR